MSYDIVVRFPSEKVAKEFIGQMSDGFGENYCDFLPYVKNDKGEFKEVVTSKGEIPAGVTICSVNELFFPEDE